LSKLQGGISVWRLCCSVFAFAPLSRLCLQTSDNLTKLIANNSLLFLYCKTSAKGSAATSIAAQEFVLKALRRNLRGPLRHRSFDGSQPQRHTTPSMSTHDRSKNVLNVPLIIANMIIGISRSPAAPANPHSTRSDRGRLPRQRPYGSYAYPLLVLAISKSNGSVVSLTTGRSTKVIRVFSAFASQGAAPISSTKASTTTPVTTY
jgi:hypothetical protein